MELFALVHPSCMHVRYFAIVLFAFRTVVVSHTPFPRRASMMAFLHWQLDGNTFLYTRHLNLYLVAVTRGNVNPAMVFEFLYQKIRIFKAYFKRDFDEDTLRNNMTLILELMDGEKRMDKSARPEGAALKKQCDSITAVLEMFLSPLFRQKIRTSYPVVSC